MNNDESSDIELNNAQVNQEMSKGLHPRNLHNNGYDFPALVETFPALKDFVKPNKFGDQSVDFADPAAVKALNCALLLHHYGIAGWNVPKGYLCPPIPGRVDYIHHVADLLQSVGIGRGDKDVRMLDIGTGANGIYSLLAAKAYGWQCTASDIDPAALNNLAAIVDKNPSLMDQVQLRLQTEPSRIFNGIIKPNDQFDVSVCNPPFHASQHEAMKSNRRKVNSLAHSKNKSETPKTKSMNKPSPALNFGGVSSELWCEGGEIAFLKTMINESKTFGKQCRWFTTLVSKADNLKPVQWLLHDLQAKKVKVIDMQQGNKSTRILAWTFA
ncbi:MAG: 23S rRNA (adenine(1618)-N(6))-methyltransferase RlmF [Limnobacter sp.]|nr:23S rRNA (adenine(1618)-N(6))-methyltransferase RlmF [Limnobacter sp.]